MKRHLISAADLTREETVLILDTAAELASVAERPIRKLPTPPSSSGASTRTSARSRSSPSRWPTSGVRASRSAKRR